MISIISVESTTIPPISPRDATTNNTKDPRLLNNNRVSVSVATGCFSSDTLVTLVDQKQIPIGELQSGDQLLTADGTRVSTTEMMMMLDRSERSLAMFQTIVTDSGHKLSLTPLHLLLTLSEEGTEKHKSARDVQAGDILRVLINDKVSSSPVINITTEMKEGFYAPLTISGTLLVNGIVASCYANVKDHDMVQFYFQPLQWYYRMSRWFMVDNPFGGEKNDGMHIIPRIFYELVQSMYPSVLRTF